MKKPTDLYTVEDGKLRFHLHQGQLKAWNSKKRFVLVLAGTQGGKTSFGPLWLLREIQRCGPGDYIVATPTFPLLELKLLPEFKRLFEFHLDLGRYTGGSGKKFVFSPAGIKYLFGDQGDDTKILFGHAQDPDSLESATAKGAWLDEAGQKKFKQGSWEALLRRLSIHQGRVLLTTTPYYLGWLKNDLHDPALRGDPEIDLIRFESRHNPAFPKAEWDARKAKMQKWKFDLFYRAIFTRPPGLIYDNFDRDKHTIPPIPIPKEWPRYWGLDFGGVNTACVKYALEPGTNRLFLYEEYKAGQRTAKQHVEALLKNEPGLPVRVRGGSKSEDQWRNEFAQAGLPVLEPVVSEVEVGIDRVYSAHAEERIKAFDTCEGYLEQKESYSRELDEQGEPTEKIEDKDTYHFMDAERYIISDLQREAVEYESTKLRSQRRTMQGSRR
jgi:hypothetical protein